MYEDVNVCIWGWQQPLSWDWRDIIKRNFIAQGIWVWLNRLNVWCQQHITGAWCQHHITCTLVLTACFQEQASPSNPVLFWVHNSSIDKGQTLLPQGDNTKNNFIISSFQTIIHIYSTVNKMQLYFDMRARVCVSCLMVASIYCNKNLECEKNYLQYFKKIIAEN